MGGPAQLAVPVAARGAGAVCAHSILPLALARLPAVPRGPARGLFGLRAPRACGYGLAAMRRAIMRAIGWPIGCPWAPAAAARAAAAVFFLKQRISWRIYLADIA